MALRRNYTNAIHSLTSSPAPNMSSTMVAEKPQLDQAVSIVSCLLVETRIFNDLFVLARVLTNWRSEIISVCSACYSSSSLPSFCSFLVCQFSFHSVSLIEQALVILNVPLPSIPCLSLPRKIALLGCITLSLKTTTFHSEAMRLISSTLGWSLLCSSLVCAHNAILDRAAKIVTVYVPAPTFTPPSSYTAESSLIDSALNSTNDFRSQHNANPLNWNTSLANAASSWASKCQWKHSGGPTGENLAIGYPDMTTAIDAWGNERSLYDFSGPTGFSERTGHFTQLVWKDTTSMGCAAIDCTGRNSLKGFMVVCEYWPPGNVVGEGNSHFRTNVQAQVHQEVRRSSESIKQETTTLASTMQTSTATVVQVVTSAEFMATRSQSTAFALGDEAAADQLEAKAMGRWAMGVAVAAMVIAGAIG